MQRGHGVVTHHSGAGRDDEVDVGHVCGERRGLHLTLESHRTQVGGCGRVEVEVELVLDSREHRAHVPRRQCSRQVVYVAQHGSLRRDAGLGPEAHDPAGQQGDAGAVADAPGRVGEERREGGILDQDVGEAGNAC